MTIYGLVDPDTGIVRYVGRTANPAQRRAIHLSHSHSPGIRAWSKTLRERGLRPLFCPLPEYETEAQAIIALTPDLNVLLPKAMLPARKGPKKTKEPESPRIVVKVTRGELECVKDAAARRNRTLSDFVRRRLGRALTTAQGKDQ